jgi:hypothetical protein
MKHPSKPDTQADEYLPDLPSAHRTPPRPEGGLKSAPTSDGTSDPASEGINPIDTETMPRAEDDERTRDASIEFNDRPDAPPRPDTPRLTR